MRTRFTIRTLVVALAVVAVIMLPIASLVHSARQQEWAARELSRAGARIGFEHSWDADSREIQTTAAPGPAIVRWLLGEHLLSRVDFVAFVEFEDNEETYDLLPELQHAKWVSFVNGNVTQPFVEAVCQMPNVTFLNLSDTDLNDKYLEQLAQIPSLKHVNINGTSVTPEGVENYRRIRPENTISSGFDPIFMEGLLRLMAMSGKSGL